MDPASEAPASVAFGRFRVLPLRRELLADDRPIRLGGRAFDVLMALIEARGAVVSKDALMARVWPGRIVEENNLQSQIVALRKAFGEERELIRTISGRGYQFTGEISTASTAAERVVGSGVSAAKTPLPTNLPAPLSDLIGRDGELSEILSLAAAHRLITLTGAGGIGKTQLALAAARRLLPRFAGGVWLADLSPLSDPALIPVTVATAIGLDRGGGEASAQRVAQALASRPLLLVLDNCEHMIDAAAAMAEAVLRAGGGAQVIATSREPLRAEGEWIYPVPPLAVPAADENPNEALEYGAIRLFIERAHAAQPNFVPEGRVIQIIAVICRRLDGIPLAIELAAARAAVLGVEEVAAQLDESFQLLTGGRRTAPPRHRALRAMLDWSHQLLTEHERIVLRRVAIFAGPFSLDAASAVVSSAEIAPSGVIHNLSSLTEKSLAVAEAGGPVARYRLLDTTRAYAREKLAESGERDRLVRRFAEYGQTMLKQAEAECETRPNAEWMARYAWRIDNVRAALDWAFSKDGDASVGVALTAAAVPFLMHLSLMDECRSRVEQALAAVTAGADCDPHREMMLHAALATSLRYTRGAVSEMGSAWTRALEFAEQLDDPEYQLRALSGLWVFHTASDRHRAALILAQKFRTLATTRSNPNDRMVGERLIGASHHFLGDQESARRHLGRVLAEYNSPGARSHIVRFQYDLRVTANALLARILWLQGFSDQAMRAAETSVADAQADNHAMSLCYALVHAACPLALWVGNLTLAEEYIRMLLDHSTRHALAFWHAFGLSYQGALGVRGGDVTTGLRLLRTGFDELGDASSALRFITFVGEMAEGLGRAGQITEALATIDETIARSEQTNERWWMTDLLRVKGELILLQDAPGAMTRAEDHFREAIDRAGRQGALSWELRATTSLARLLCDQNRSADASALIRPVYDRFTEGFDSADLKSAKALLDALR